MNNLAQMLKNPLDSLQHLHQLRIRVYWPHISINPLSIY